MSTVIVTIGGTPTPGDLLMLSYSHPVRGGVSTLQYKVRPSVDYIVDDGAGNKVVKTVSDTLESIVQGLIDEFNRGQQWPLPEFEVTKRNATQFVVSQKNLADSSFFVGIKFRGDVEGADGAAPTETMELEVF